MEKARDGMQADQDDAAGMLDRFVALDLTSGHLRFAGSLLAQLGMRVVRPCRAVDEEMGDAAAWYENCGKALWPVAEWAVVEPVAARADVILADEQTPKVWGVSADDLAARYERAIVGAILPYGAGGPWSGFAAAELTLQAASGQMWLNGDPDRPPVPVAGNQSAYQGAAQAVVGVLAALCGRERGEGAGDLVDVSRQEAMCNTIVITKQWWYLAARNLMRSSMSTIGGQVQTRTVWRASDGYICWRMALGLGENDRGMRAHVEWMIQDAGIGEELRDIDWGHISTLEVKVEDIRRWEAVFAAFFERKTRAELFQGARERNIILVPVLTLDDLLRDEHLLARGAFQEASTAAGRFRVPAFPVRASGLDPRRRPPRVIEGEPDFPPPSQPPTGRSEEIAPSPHHPGSLKPSPPLAGIHIVDFGWAVAGPVTTRHLGMLGATVVKVETNTRLDTTRASTPFVGRPSRDRSGYFAAHNNNKLSLTLDLNKSGSRSVLRRLVEWADIVSENYSAGRLERWDLGYDVLRSWRQDLILLRSSTWGQEGPYAGARANGVVLGGFAGIGHLTGWPDRPPLLPVEPYTDMISPWFAVATVIGALLRRLATGRGAEIDVSQVECAINFLGPEIAAASAGRPPARVGPFALAPYPAGVFRCAGEEEWCALSVQDAAQWQALCRTVPGLAGVEDLPPDTLAGLAPFCFAALAAYFAGQAAPAAVHALQARGIAAAKVAKPEDLFHDPQLAYRRHFVERPHPSMGKYAYEMPSFRYRHRPIAVERSPLIGEHSGLVLKQFLGYTDDEIADFYAEGVVN